jgi:hypothetical protein
MILFGKIRITIKEGEPPSLRNTTHHPTVADVSVLATVRLVDAGHVMTGSWLSTTITENEQLSVFPARSVDTHEMVVVPTVKTWSVTTRLQVSVLMPVLSVAVAFCHAMVA